MTVRVKRDSRLNFLPLVTLDSYEFFDFEPYPEFAARPDDLWYQVVAGDRPDTLGQKFYGSPRLWWVVAVANELEILPSQLYVGQILRIPNPGFVRQKLFKG